MANGENWLEEISGEAGYGYGHGYTILFETYLYANCWLPNLLFNSSY